MHTRDLFVDLYRHMEWADAATWRAVLGSTGARADESMRVRLHHIHLVQRAFLSIWRGEPIDVHAGEALSLGDLATWAGPYYAEARAEIARPGAPPLDGTVQVPWSKQIVERLGFEPAATTLADTIVQVYGHTSHHRGQVLARLRELGTTPPFVDYIAWVWQGRPAAAWP
jgi:uncharacterized damage-inducible protein DinB